MNFLRTLIVRLTESKRSQAGQTMTEYVLIVAAIAVAGYVAYQGLETGINGVITKVTASLNAA
jgi:Flp pilus assembly pilin Flp